MGELVAPESGRASIQHPSLAPGALEPRNSIAAKSAASAALGATAAARRSSTSADTESFDGHLAAIDAAMPSIKEAPMFAADSSRSLDHSLSEANLRAFSSQSLDGSFSKRQLTSMRSMQSEASHDGSKKRTIRHSLSGKLTPTAALATSSTYSGRYATKQLSGKASPAQIDGALSPRRSLLVSPTASVHGGQPSSSQQSSISGSGRPATAVESDDRPGTTLAGAAAVLKSQTRPSSVDGAGWHLATGDGLPFSPRGSLVASSGGSRTLRPITSQQEALFDAEGNMLPRPDWQPDSAQTGLTASAPPAAPVSAAGAETASKVKQKFQFQTDLGLKSKAGPLNGAETDPDGIPARQRSPAKQGMLSIVMFPCFCLRPRTTSAEEPNPEGSLRQRFAAKQGTAVTQAAAHSKSIAVPKSALKQKQPNSMALDMGKPDWELGSQVHQPEAVTSSDVDLPEAGEPEGEGQGGRSLQGAISLAPIRSGLASATTDQTSLQQVLEVTSCFLLGWSPIPCSLHLLTRHHAAFVLCVFNSW